MGTWLDRYTLVRVFLAELRRYGMPDVAGPLDREVIFVVDGVGGFQAAPVMVRRALRQSEAPIGTVVFRWQCRPPGQVLADLMWHRRNRRKAEAFAAELVRFHRDYPDARIHVLALSGGTGIAVFACEHLPSRLIDTMVLACPAISPEYDLGAALAAVNRCYALISHRDTWILGLGTRMFGTMDRGFTRSAGMVGFRRPTRLVAPAAQPPPTSSRPVGVDGGDVRDPGIPNIDGYERLFQIEWSPELIALGHHGGHTGWGSVPFLREHLVPLLRGEPKLPAFQVV